MDIGIGFTETLLILLLVLVFFGSKELPGILRQIGRIVGLVRQKANEFYGEINQAAEPQSDFEKDAAERKKMIRTEYKAIRQSMSPDEREARSRTIAERLFGDDVWREAHAVLVYLALPQEVHTDGIVQAAFAQEKRVVVPYVVPAPEHLEIAEITDLETCVNPGTYGIREPVPGKSGRFLKSDVDLVICPGLAFDRHGGRLGFGKGFYDGFLRELTGKTPIVGLAFANQILPEKLPFSYHDIAMDKIFTDTETITGMDG